MSYTVSVKATGEHPWPCRYGSVPTDKFVERPCVSEVMRGVNSGELEREFRSAANDAGATQEIQQQDNEGPVAEEYEFSPSDHETHEEEA